MISTDLAAGTRTLGRMERRRNIGGIAVGAAAVAPWLVIVALGVIAGGQYAARHGEIDLDAAPFVGRWSFLPIWRIIPAALFGTVAVLASSRITRDLSWRRLLGVAFAAELGWAVVLAVSEGTDALTRPLQTRFEYLAAVPLVGSPHRFLSTFTEQWMQFPTHVKAHPPGLVLVLWCLRHVGLGGAGPAAALELLVGASAVPAALMVVRDVASESAARRVAPFLVLAPVAIWASSGDFLFAGVIAWAIAVSVRATSARHTRSYVLAAAGGALWGASLLLSYGALPLGLLPVAVALWRRRVDTLALLGVTAGAALVLVGALGFWWPDGLRVTHSAYVAGVSRARPYHTFLVLDIAAFVTAIGPVTVVALLRLRERALWLLSGSALAAVAAACVSGLSKGEVERIWLPFVPWILVGAGAVVTSSHARRRWLGIQVAFTCLLQLALRSPW